HTHTHTHNTEPRWETAPLKPLAICSRGRGRGDVLQACLEHSRETLLQTAREWGGEEGYGNSIPKQREEGREGERERWTDGGGREREREREMRERWTKEKGRDGMYCEAVCSL